MIELTLNEQIQIRKKTYAECKYIKDDNIRKSYFKKLRIIKHDHHELNKKFDDVDFDELIDDARTAIKKAKQGDAGAVADAFFDVSVSRKADGVADRLE
jgi:hypothetical protein